MNYNYLMKNRSLNRDKLLQFGFSPAESEDLLEYRRDLYNGLYLQVRISLKQLDVDVFDSLFDQKYAPFTSGHGGAAVKSQVREILEEILANCTDLQS